MRLAGFPVKYTPPGCYPSAMKYALLALLVAVAVAVGLYVHARNVARREAWESAYQRAFDAYGRAAEYRSEDALVFEPRYKDLEVALDEFFATPGPGDSSSHAGEKSMGMVGCKIVLDTYRIQLKNSNLQDQIDKLEGHRTKGPGADFLKTDEEVSSCERTGHSP